jgi:hypothetical protein
MCLLIMLLAWCLGSYEWDGCISSYRMVFWSEIGFGLRIFWLIDDYYTAGLEIEHEFGTFCR